jgi:hypothetical protein
VPYNDPDIQSVGRCDHGFDVISALFARAIWIRRNRTDCGVGIFNVLRYLSLRLRDDIGDASIPGRRLVNMRP